MGLIFMYFTLPVWVTIYLIIPLLSGLGLGKCIKNLVKKEGKRGGSVVGIVFSGIFLSFWLFCVIWFMIFLPVLTSFM